MYLTEYVMNQPPEDQVLLEFGQPPGQPGGRQQSGMGPLMGPSNGQQMGPIGQPQDIGPPSSGLIEFEDIKKYLLYGRLKEIKLKLEMAKINRQDPEILNIFEFLDLVIMFYNTFTYEQAQRLVDVLLETMSQKLNIKIPGKEIAEKPIDQDAANQMQAQQDQMQQQAAQDQADQEKQAQQDDIDQQKMDLDQQKVALHQDKQAHNLAKDKMTHELTKKEMVTDLKQQQLKSKETKSVEKKKSNKSSGSK